MRSLALALFAGILLLCIAQAAYYYPFLPEKVASHFNASGMPDAWMDKGSFITTYLLVTSFAALLFPAMNLLLRILPLSMINLPNKDYWLAPKRKDAAFDRLASFFLLFGAATLALLLDIFHQAFLVSLGRAQSLEHPVVSLVLYVGFTAVWSIVMIRGFRRKE